MENIKAPIYAYIKGNRYKTYSIYREADEELEEVKMTFENLETLIEFIHNFSNYYSISVQFYK